MPLCYAFMSAAGICVALALLASQDPAPSTDVKLATLPDGVTIASDYLVLTNRGRMQKRSTLVFAADGKSVAYAGRRGDEWIPVVGSQLGEAFDYVGPPVIAGGRAFFKVGRSLGGGKEHAWVWVDGKLIGPEDWMGDIAVSPDGSRVAYWTQPGAVVGNAPAPSKRTCFLAVASETEKGKWSVARGAEWKDGGTVAPLFSADGERAFTTALGPKGWMLLARQRKEIVSSDPFTLIESLAISRDGGVQAFVTTRAMDNDSLAEPAARDKAELVFQGKRWGKNFSAITRPAVDASGKHVAFIVCTEKAASVAVDDEKTLRGAFDHVLELAWDPTGRRIAFVANTGGVWSKEIPGLLEGGESYVVVRDVAADAELREDPHHAAVENLVWDAAGERVACRAKTESGWRIVCGDAQSEPHDEVGVPQFAGEKIRFGSRDGRELWWREMARP